MRNIAPKKKLLRMLFLILKKKNLKPPKYNLFTKNFSKGYHKKFQAELCLRKI